MPDPGPSTGGRTDWSGTQNTIGDAYDHFAINFWYPENVHATFSSHQLNGSFSDLCVRCFGVNGCAGKGACKSTKNDCKGKNACKGQGWLSMLQSECSDKQGQWEAISG